MEFTKKQIEDWRAFERVRLSGEINMFDVNNGTILSGLTPEDYRFAMKNYSELKAVADKESV